MHLEYYEIDFSREQMIYFILPNLVLLREGEWPSRESSYYYPEYKGPNKSRCARFEKPELIAGEVDYRIDKLGKFWPIPTAIYTYMEEPLNLARRYRMTAEQFDRELKSIVKYISGYKRKKVDYRMWKAIRKNNIKNDIKIKEVRNV